MADLTTSAVAAGRHARPAQGPAPARAAPPLPPAGTGTAAAAPGGRHARPPPAGPARRARQRTGHPRQSFFRWLAVLTPLIPLAVMVRPLLDNAPRLQIYGGQVLGLGATLCLLSCLAVTPVTRVLRWKRANWWRKWLGLCVFFLGAAGFVIVATGGLRSQSMMNLAGSGQNWTGTVIVIALIPLALTSNRFSQKRLGSYWKDWQYRVTWAAWVLLAVHIAVLAAWQTGMAFWMASAPLLAMRVPAVRKDLGRWKAAGYEDSARWLLTGLAAGVFACGAGLLLWMEVVACAGAIRLS